MPFKSNKQRRYLWKNEPDIAQKWADEEKPRRDRTPSKKSKKRQRKKKPKKGGEE